MSTVKLRFINEDATPKEVAFDVSKDGVAPILSWYGGYHSGDDYVVYVDGVKAAIDLNGELIAGLA
ncbi:MULTISPECIES: hypothetical protein [unclassified Ensifer]|uniref:hypothetical protein n=1 Tax=unclassified Ensifer TaxID=2633371 RepID=UPI00081373FE|nr:MULTISPECIES: hypothetical protein [unclassified Ensifer]OCP21951.1 hypothetical protein BC361_25620 [Ensifer sp. LC54]OCP23269.1 hypothetical protein BC363_25145 [Ensifer sp. LC384]